MALKTILVVKTCDGPVYFAKVRWKAATDLAYDQVMNFGVLDLNREDFETLRDARLKLNDRGLFWKLKNVDAITEAALL